MHAKKFAKSVKKPLARYARRSVAKLAMLHALVAKKSFVKNVQMERHAKSVDTEHVKNVPRTCTEAGVSARHRAWRKSFLKKADEIKRFESDASVNNLLKNFHITYRSTKKICSLLYTLTFNFSCCNCS